MSGEFLDNGLTVTRKRLRYPIFSLKEVSKGFSENYTK